MRCSVLLLQLGYSLLNASVQKMGKIDGNDSENYFVN